MIKTGYRAIYTPAGKVNFSDLDLHCPGVYLIRENRRLVYVGHSRINLYKTLMRHFERWNHYLGWNVTTYRDRLKTKRYTVKLFLCTASQAPRLEKLFILKLKPRDNVEKYQSMKAAPVKAKKIKPNIRPRHDVPF